MHIFILQVTNIDVAMTTKVQSEIISLLHVVLNLLNVQTFIPIYMCILQTYINPVTLYVILHDRYTVGGNLGSLQEVLRD